ncbi:MAG TPA: class I SAM-dependent methyltransferase [Rhizomicrobium sp.]|jgi:ubiquinone/menaquinone biosynthesis C-methylase UbiE|nr:class I SAM-dependent methyltransferase [Rhizomicrobium sp.]
MNHPDYDPRRFQANVPFYARYRLGYPDRLIGLIAASAGVREGDPVLDLGAGPGLLAVPFARARMAVTAVDPEPDMLKALRAAAAAAQVSIEILQGSSFDMPPRIGPFRLVTIGRAFHWMDRVAALEMLDRQIVTGGALALVHDHHPETAENAWRSALREIADRFGRAVAPHVRAARSSGYRSHESVLLDSAFSRLERTGVIIRRELSADDIVGLGYSLSALSPAKLGQRAQAFEADLRAELSRLSPDGRFAEIAELSALIAKRA